MKDRATILYDDDCGFCKRLLRQLLRWDTKHRLRPVALQSAEADTLLRGMDHDQKMASWHLVTPDGAIHSGGEALPVLFRLLPNGAPLAKVFGIFPGPTDFAYRWVARNRTALSRITRSRGAKLTR